MLMVNVIRNCEYLGKLDRGLKLNGKPIQKDYTMMLHLLMEETAC